MGGHVSHTLPSLYFCNTLRNARAPRRMRARINYNRTSVSSRNCERRYRVAYPIEFLCLSIALLTVLDRMRRFAMPEAVTSARVVVAAVVVGDVVGLCASFAAAADHVQTSVYWRRTSAACCNFNSSEFLTLIRQARELTERTASTASVNYFSEVVVLIIIVGSFSCVGFVSARRVRNSVQLIRISASSAAAAIGKELRLSIMATTAFVFVTFLLRLIYSAMFAFAFAFQDSANDITSCSSASSNPASNQGYCSPCFNTCAARALAFLRYNNVTSSADSRTCCNGWTSPPSSRSLLFLFPPRCPSWWRFGA